MEKDAADAATNAAEATLPPLRQVIATHGLSARKKLGQNFLLDLNLTRRIARAVGDLENAHVVEIGPGPGGLTRALFLEGATNIIAIERDERCLPALAEIADAWPGRLQVIRADALEINIPDLIKDTDTGQQTGQQIGEQIGQQIGQQRPVKIVANLPYNVATPLLIKWLGQASNYASFTLMFQKEVADRLCARPRTKEYGRLSILAQWRCQVTPLFTIPARAFTPAPKVDSTVVALVPRDGPLAPANEKILEQVVKYAFNQRRKMLRSALKPLMGSQARKVLENAAIKPTSRAEEVSVTQFCALARAWETQMKDSPPTSKPA